MSGDVVFSAGSLAVIGAILASMIAFGRILFRLAIGRGERAEAQVDALQATLVKLAEAVDDGTQQLTAIRADLLALRNEIRERDGRPRG